jgi:hypothetical protein
MNFEVLKCSSIKYVLGLNIFLIIWQQYSGFSKLIKNVVTQGFSKNLYEFIGVHLQYKRKIVNQLNIHDFYNIFLFSNPNHFYVIYTIIQNEWNLIYTIYNSNFALNLPHYNLHLINNLSFWHAFNSPKDGSNFR